jgi:hypothetical protein
MALRETALEVAVFNGREEICVVAIVVVVQRRGGGGGGGGEEMTV